MHFHLFKSKKILRLLLVVVLCAVISKVFFFSGKKSYAEEAFLFPQVCQGTWTNSQVVAGEKFVSDSIVGARSTAAGDEITCQSFSGTIPSDIVIKSATIHFLWKEATENQATPPPPTLEESYDPVGSSSGNIEFKEIKPDTEKEIDQVEPFLEVNSEPSPSREETTLPSDLKDENIPKEEPTTQDFKLEPVSNPTKPVSWRSTLFKWLAVASAQAEEIDKPTPTPSLSEEDTFPEQSRNIISSIVDSKEDNTKELTPENVSQPFAPAIEISPQTLPPLDQMIETGLFQVDYQLDDSPPQKLGLITQESLEKAFSIPVSIETIPKLRVRLTSLLTLDAKQLLELTGMKLVIEYNRNVEEDPIKQPNLEIDSLLNTLQTGQYEVIRIQRADTKEYEIWYRELTESELINNTPVSEIESDQVDSEEDSPEKKPVFYWNFVAGKELVHETLPIALHDGYIFWFNAEGNDLYAYSILTQGINSQSFSPQDNNISIVYFGPAKQERKAVYDKQTLSFSFFDAAL